ncbi:phage major capsid protein [Aestuarium zhoushanense]|jgi:HK97 family phage major capsid protein|uniref:phage major capsid protein n=1 Tax=Marivivens sp. TaxID=1978374 RepID=UPI000CA352BD|nr:phage major capsid protein [Marivivens sp.]AUJ63815.1 phage major capsid protein [Aestuarium zhoushanense]NVJ96036.1 phage major capsid protein [Marivivens sp.]
MTKPEATPRAGEDMSPVQDLKSAITDFVSEFKQFSNGVHAKLQQQEDRMTKYDRKSLMASRPALSGAEMIEAPHQKAFAAYLRSGEDEGLRDLPLEGKAMSTAVAADGGYLVDPQTSDTIKSALTATASIRAIASIVTVESTSYDVLIDHTEMGSGWANEAANLSETATPQIDRITIPVNELSAMPKISQRLLDDSAFDIEGWLAGRIADKFARSEASAFVNGDGVDKPKGFLDYPTVDEMIWTWGNIGYVVTGTAGAIDDGDPIIELVYALGAEYRANATFVMNSKTAGTVRKLKDADGRFLWSDGLSQGEPARLMGYPVLIAEDMPDVAADAMAIAFGDFANGYTIAERPDVRVLRDPFSAKPHVLFYATKRVGGAVSDFNAIKLLKFGTA